jgi:MFS transporter, PAT family, beta-lactamase induction signal transducer AmpG
MPRPSTSPLQRSPWTWIPTLYFGQGIPYVVVMTLSVIMYKRLEVSNTDIALYTSWLYLPWVIKPLWSPLVDMLRTKRFWILVLQLLVGATLALVALTLPLPGFFRLTLAAFWLMAFSSATHDIAADGFYMLALPQQQQAAFVGVRSTFYRLSMIAGQGGLVMLAGQIEALSGNTVFAWQVVLFVLGALFAVLAVYHRFALPWPAADRPAQRGDGAWWAAYLGVFGAFFRRPDIGLVLAFLLLYRFAESQLLKLAAPFLLDGVAQGGLGLSTTELGLVYGGIGVVCLTLGGLLGGWVISRHGLRRWLWPMVLLMHLPNLLFVALAATQPQSLWVIAAAVGLEQFGYGFGFAAFMVFMLMVAAGPDGSNPHQTAHYAICTGFMALGMMLPGMASGWLQSQLGYLNFFIWVCIATLPSLLAVAVQNIDPAFGRRAE